MKALYKKDFKARRDFFKNEKLRILKKFIFINFLNQTVINSSQSSNQQFKKIKQLIFLTKNFKFSSKGKTKMVRRCILNNRGHGVHRTFSISRVLFREMLQFGLIPGFSKSVW